MAHADTFGRHAHNWWDLNGPLRTLHHINPTRVAFIEQYMSQFCDGNDILDVGCGAGILTEALAKKQYHMHGIDLSQHLIDAANTHAQTQNLQIHYHQGALHPNNPSLLDQSFSALTCLEVLEHVADPWSLLNNCNHFLKPGGLLFLSTINATLKAYLETIVIAEKILKLIPDGTHQFDGFLKPSQLLNWARQHGFECLALKGLTYRPLLKKAVLTGNLQNNYIMCLQKPNLPEGHS